MFVTIMLLNEFFILICPLVNPELGSDGLDDTVETSEAQVPSPMNFIHNLNFITSLKYITYTPAYHTSISHNEYLQLSPHLASFLSFIPFQVSRYLHILLEPNTYHLTGSGQTTDY